jgi:Reverse transcriptase (RNA-dependent DNA polymerase)
MGSKGVCSLSSFPPAMKLVGNRWVYNKKDDGTNRSRTVAQGFSQVPGKAFIDSRSPVMTDLSLRLALIIKELKKIRTTQFDIETASYFQSLTKEST